MAPTSAARRSFAWRSDRDGPGPLPNFLLIGAMKAGTTSMYHYLRAHPQVYMPTFKAPEFFAGKALSKRGVDWYRRQFADVGPDAVAIGEASNVYTKFPHYPGVPARIAELIPDVRLLYIVRDPVARIRSHYQTRVVEGAEKLPLMEALSSNGIYLDYSRYAMQIEQYLEHFPREQLLVTTAEGLRRDRDAVVRQVYEFLGVDPEIRPDDLDREFYLSADKPGRSLLPIGLKRALKTHVPSTKRFKELEANVVRRLDKVRGRSQADKAQQADAVVGDAERAYIVEALRDDVTRLRTYLDDGFDGWSIA
jgi:Sulfotransferase domain